VFTLLYIYCINKITNFQGDYAWLKSCL